MGSVDLRRFASPEELAATAAGDCLSLLIEQSRGEEAFTMALSGGRIAKTFCSALAGEVKDRGMSLRNVHFFWSDERCVPPEDPESNFRLAAEFLLKPLRIPESQIHRILGELAPAQSFAAAEAELCRMTNPSSGQPMIDLVLLGMGEDGHVASLFPGESEGAIADPAVFRCVTAVKPPPLRVTMGYSTIAAAKNVWVLASGAGKAAALRESLRADGRTPLARVIQMRNGIRVYTDIQPSGKFR